MIVRTYELTPCDSHKSFYGKAKVIITDTGLKILKSYDTIVAVEDSNGVIHKLWDGWSATTGRHIRSFCGMNKSEFMNLELESQRESNPNRNQNEIHLEVIPIPKFNENALHHFTNTIIEFNF